MELNQQPGLACRYGDLNEINGLMERGATLKLDDRSAMR